MSDTRLEYAPTGKQTDKSWFGYNYLGPGTDIYGKVERGVKPVDGLDAAARRHDIAYANVSAQYERGLISRSKANRIVEKADWSLANRAAVEFLKGAPGMGLELVQGNVKGALKKALSMAPAMYTSVGMRTKWLLSQVGIMPGSFASLKKRKR